MTSYRQVRRALCNVMSHKDFLATSIDEMGNRMLISGDGHVVSLIDEDASGDRNNAANEDTEPSKKNKVERSLKKAFNTIPELRRKRLAEKYKDPNGGRKDTTKHEPVFLKDNERLRCTICCRFCFTPGTLKVGPEVIERDDFHRNVNVLPTQTSVMYDSGRQGHMADTMCKICKVPLCFKKARFPGHGDTCWRIFHSQQDLWNGDCATLCHVKNPRRELGLDCTVKEPKQRIISCYTERHKRKQLPTVVQYGGRKVPRRGSVLVSEERSS